MSEDVSAASRNIILILMATILVYLAVFSISSLKNIEKNDYEIDISEYTVYVDGIEVKSLDSYSYNSLSRRYQIMEDKEAEVLILTTKADNAPFLPIPIFYGY